MASLIFGLGYLGAALARALVRQGQPVVGLDNAFATDWRALEQLAAQSGGALRVLRGDIRCVDDIERAFDAADPVETVYLLAAQASAHPAAAPAEYTEETNLRGARLVFETALRHGAPPVVYSSSFHVYGPGLHGTIDESHPYGLVRDLAHLSKIYVEKLGELLAATRGLLVAPVRLGIVYGLGPVMKRDLRFVTVPHAFCLRALAGQTLEVHPSGRLPLGFVHLDDAIEALRLAAVALAGAATPAPAGSAPPAAGGAYWPANAVSEVATVLDVARLVQEAMAARGGAISVQTPAGLEPRGSHSTAAPGYRVASRLYTCGWQPRECLAREIPRLLDYYACVAGASPAAERREAPHR